MSSPSSHHTPTAGGDFVTRQLLNLLSFLILLGISWDWERGSMP